MAIVRPFKGVRPKPELARDIAALPYDVMSSLEAREMTKDTPLSFLYIDRPELNFGPEQNMYADEVYTKAREVYENMKTKGEFVQDATPVLYIYQQEMDGRKQMGLVAATSIDEYLNNTIKKHELTRKEKEEDRIRHVDAMDANTGPIFLTYRGKAAISATIKAWAESHKPVYDFVSEDNVGHVVWIIDDAAVIKELTDAFAKDVDALYIADGHHRNASAVAVGLKRREQKPNYNMEDELNYYLSVIFPDDELAIMDYNRVVKDLNDLSKDEFIAKLGDKFDVSPWSGGAYKPEARHMFGMYLDGAWYKLVAKPEFIDEKDPVASLDVSILQSQLLTPVLNIQDPRTDSRIDFVGGLRGLGELEKRVNSGNMKVAFSMFPTSMAELMAISDADKLMPPKSTWFEPKLRSGLFVHELSN